MSETTVSRELGNRFVRAIGSAWRELWGAPTHSRGAVERASRPERETLEARTRAAFHGAEVTRLNLGWLTGNASGNQDIAGSISLLRSRARDLARNNPYVERFLQLRFSNIVGPDGIGHQARVRFKLSDSAGNQAGDLNEPVNDYLEEKWKEWSSGPVTADGRMNLKSYLRQAMDTEAIDGESFTRMLIGRQYRFGIALQPIDPDLVSEKANHRAGKDGAEVRLGVEVDNVGRRLAYHAYDWPDYVPGSELRGLQRIPADEVIHLYRARRAHQTRGVSRLACVITDIQDVGGYEESVIIGARAGANQVAFAQWKDSATPTIANLENRKPVQLELNPGTYTELEPGLEVVAFDPSQPTGVYSEFMKTRLRRIASGLGLAHASLSNDLRDVNYSSTKVGLAAERELARLDQEDVIELFMQVLYAKWLEAATLSGALELPSVDWREYSAVQWVPRGWEWIDPLKEVQAIEAELRLGLTSRQRVLAERGGDFFALLEELEQERVAAEESGVTIEAKAPSTTPPASQDEEDPADAAPDAKREDDAEDEEEPAAKAPPKPRAGRARSVLRRVA